jgi:excisionase family DNA binding protein
MTVQEAARRLGISASLVYGLCAGRRLRHERHGLGRGKIVIPEEALEEYRKGVTVEAQAGEPPPVTCHPAKTRKFKHLT